MILTILKYVAILIGATFAVAFVAWLTLAFFYFIMVYYDAYQANKKR